jgi:cation transport regulator ChaC
VSFLYFGYGSNMLPARLCTRCPSARALGLAIARDFTLEFSKPSTDGSGKATLVPSPGSAVPGVLFEIADADREALDLHEGAGHGYRRVDDFTVEKLPAGDQGEATTYIATTTDPQLEPFDWYLAVVIAGATHHGIDGEHIARLRKCSHSIDEELERPTRLRALEAMLAHGVEDYRAFLPGSD